MKKYNNQEILKKITNEKSRINPLKIKYSQIKYLKKYLSNNKYGILYAVIFIILSVILEGAIPVFARLYLYTSKTIISSNNILNIVIILFLLALIYLIISYISQKLLNKQIYKFIYLIRKNNVLMTVQNMYSHVNYINNSSFMLKNNYLELFKVSIIKVLLSVIYIIIMFLILVFVAGLTNSSFIFLILFTFVISIFLFIISYLFSYRILLSEHGITNSIYKYYTRYVIMNNFIKDSRFYKEFARNLNEIQKTDYEIKIRKSILGSYFHKIIFICMSILASILYIYAYSGIYDIGSYIGRITFIGIFIGFLIRIGIKSIDLGNNLYMLYVGSILCIPSGNIHIYNTINKRSNKLEFISNHNKKLSSTKTNYRILFDKSIIGYFNIDDNVIENKLHKLVGCCLNEEIQYWTVKYNKNRYKYSNWKKICNFSSYISISNNIDYTLYELFTGKISSDSNSNEIIKLNEYIARNDDIQFVFDLKRNLLTNYQSDNIGYESRILLQIYSAIYRCKNIIVLSDDVWLYDRLNEKIKYIINRNNDMIWIVPKDRCNNLKVQKIEYFKVVK